MAENQDGGRENQPPTGARMRGQSLLHYRRMDGLERLITGYDPSARPDAARCKRNFGRSETSWAGRTPARFRARAGAMIFDTPTQVGQTRKMSAYAHLRQDYSLAGLSEKDLARDPFRQFEKWFQEAEAAKIPEPNAMVLATAGHDGRPSTRTLLLKGLDGRGFVFYTSFESRKGRELEASPRASLLFPWIALERQVMVEGPATKVAREETEAYFHSRPRLSQLAAWASPQSTILSGRAILDEAMKTLEKKYAGAEVPLPPYWGGFRVAPETVEFWQGRRNRLHDRLRYRREKNGDWIIERLAP
jgi:pyridoxamine 5'-phosphate oxidase